MVRGGGDTQVGDEGAASAESRLMRAAESAERRRFCGCERSRGHQKPPCAVKRQPPERAAILPRKRPLSCPLVGCRRGFQFAVPPNFTVKRRGVGIVQNPPLRRTPPKWGKARARAQCRLRRHWAAARRSRAAYAFRFAKRMARPRAVFAQVGDKGAASAASRLMRAAESVERRRFCRCERLRGYQKPPCAVKRQPPEGAAILPRKRLLPRPLVGCRRGFQFAVLPNFTVKRRGSQPCPPPLTRRARTAHAVRVRRRLAPPLIPAARFACGRRAALHLPRCPCFTKRRIDF